MPRVEVVYATPDGEDAVVVSLPPGATLLDALKASGIPARHPGIGAVRLGVFGRERPGETPVAQGDRIEVYRPLAADPKEARRRRAALSRRTTR
ncbi:MAG TPA: RnfH family protein [Burkholderiales bacterium]|nr:RnfH family protein [Burkholderiales bacterium]